jgi:hypothetical protein
MREPTNMYWNVEVLMHYSFCDSHTEHLQQLRDEAKLMAILRCSRTSWRTRVVRLLLALAQRLEPSRLEVRFERAH